MPSNSRAENQYYGKYRECCVVAHMNHTEVEYHENYVFTTEEQKVLFDEAKLIADFLGNHTATYLGNHTANESGDILLDNGDVVEIKTVSAGSGTYFNTSIYYFSKFGFDFKEYMDKCGLYEAIEQSFGTIVPVSRKNNSPVSQPNSSFIRHNYESKWKENIVPVDEAMRMKFTEDIANYFTKNPDKVYEFISDILNKKSSTSKKTSPDRLVVLNYNKGKVREIDLKNFKENISTNIRATSKGLVIGNVRIAFSWQNGVGLNNPTIRAYLED
jgi:hypothetical protein